MYGGGGEEDTMLRYKVILFILSFIIIMYSIYKSSLTRLNL